MTHQGDETLLQEAYEAVDFLLGWICNDWEWSQYDYERLDQIRNRLGERVGA